MRRPRLLKARAKAEMRAINEVLWRVWDPVGAGAPKDEYAVYVGPIYALLRAGAPRPELKAHLESLPDACVCPVSDERLQRTLDRLYALGVKRPENGMG